MTDTTEQSLPELTPAEIAEARLDAGRPFDTPRRRQARALLQLHAECERLRGPSCHLSGPGRGDCEHFIGLPDVLDATTTDHYGKPLGWCWWCWRSHEVKSLTNKLRDFDAINEQRHGAFRRADAAESLSVTQAERITTLETALDEILDYRGGAESPLHDDYVMDRVRTARMDSAHDGGVK